MAAEVAAALHGMGCYEVSMGDTTGAGTPASIFAMLEATKKLVPVQHLAAHLHDTYGQVIPCGCPECLNPSSYQGLRLSDLPNR